MNFTAGLNQILLLTVRIVCRRNHDDLERIAGTGFLLDRTLDDGSRVRYLVTARHVVENKATCQFSILLGDLFSPKLDRFQTFIIENPLTDWHYHPDQTIDVAVAVVSAIEEHKVDDLWPFFHPLIDHKAILNSIQATRLSASEEVCFVGYPRGLMDLHNNLPIVRRGYSASHYSLEFGGKAEFLMEATVIPGSSGSPVFLVRNNTLSGLLGIAVSFLVLRPSGELNKADDPEDPNEVLRGGLGLSIVIKAREIIATIDEHLRKASLVPKKLDIH